ncbi:MAG: hypothetical protein RMI94_08985 [Bryobacterales bacterium]|nr:hypothetical protein [Bryobacteraceae bacterium]MDW8130672.1 hypothetical protein [Bryobacterales bacterium]
MGRKRTSARDRLAEWLAARQPDHISETLWEEMRAALAPIPEDRLRRLLRETGLPLAPLVEGVRQDSTEEAARTLIALAREYRAATARGDMQRALACRKLVMAAKDRARWAVGNPRVSEEKRRAKKELLLWMLTWLENPAVFEPWLSLRRTVLQEAGMRDTGTQEPDP